MGISMASGNSTQLKEQNIQYEQEIFRLTQRVKSLQQMMSNKVDEFLKVATERDLYKLKLYKLQSKSEGEVDALSPEPDLNPELTEQDKEDMSILEKNQKDILKLKEKIKAKKEKYQGALDMLEEYRMRYGPLVKLNKMDAYRRKSNSPLRTRRPIKSTPKIKKNR